ncbi:MAG: DUF1254 domain-containing protein [Pseudomonadota bacterium]
MLFTGYRIWSFAGLAACLGATATAQGLDATIDTLAGTQSVPLNIDNFIRAATDIELDKYVALGGGVNQFFHFKEPIPIDNQPTIRMNRDTLYSTVVVDISEGAVLTLPDVGERYMTTMVVNQDHFVNEVFNGGGRFELDMDTFDTPYIIAFIRILVDASDPEDVAIVNALQQQMTLDAASANPFVPPNYDEESFEGLLNTILAFGPFVPDSTRMFGSRDQVDGVRHLIGTAGGLGGASRGRGAVSQLRSGSSGG